ncbi:MAG TPA: CAP domain-containing protein [Methylocystis sp.]|nr:CAP domain-containing protein [Methylocystis sp.]
MKRARLFLFCLSASLSACAPPVEERSAPPPSSAEPSFYRSLARAGAAVDQDAARDMISQYRRNNGLGALALDDRLSAAAQRLADEMASRSAVVPQSALNLERRLEAAGVQTKSGAANVSAGYQTLAEAFSGWRQSPPHNARMLAAGARRMGLATAYAKKGKYRVYWALLLAD